tara:strand:+ start:302 stop:643 length:342 start_codon:yes stop_codon:yes gene_type:complete
MYKKIVIFIFFIFCVNLSNKVKADFFQEVQPNDETEFFLYGGAVGVANTLCQIFVDNKISLIYAKRTKKDYVNYFMKNSKREYDIANAGFNDGITSMEQQGNKFKKCLLLKSK